MNENEKQREKQQKKRSGILSRGNSPKINFPNDAITKKSHQKSYFWPFISHRIDAAC